MYIGSYLVTSSYLRQYLKKSFILKRCFLLGKIIKCTYSKRKRKGWISNCVDYSALQYGSGGVARFNSRIKWKNRFCRGALCRNNSSLNDCWSTINTSCSCSAAAVIIRPQPSSLFLCLSFISSY